MSIFTSITIAELLSLTCVGVILTLVIPTSTVTCTSTSVVYYDEVRHVAWCRTGALGSTVFEMTSLNAPAPNTVIEGRIDDKDDASDSISRRLYLPLDISKSTVSSRSRLFCVSLGFPCRWFTYTTTTRPLFGRHLLATHVVYWLRTMHVEDICNISLIQFAISVLFHCMVSLCVWRAGVGVFRARRRRRGLCELCGYPARVGKHCPECGLMSVPVHPKKLIR